ncbi:MAG: PepSY domain-containing protein [Defluviimonas sp.]|uniref:PepSY-associated TM helix domain-containing protein n=1 Tax=Albidovulum sp. TaxID=1872424 RepID=UPI001DFF10BC|nr:PepSY domain-containing protein [Paracoccaceae bacterium]MCC0063316.1 PepSY domain-containing protein [Defluviimonas sp.]
MAKALRTLVFRLHRFVGRMAILLFALSFCTGVLLLFAPEIEQIDRPDFWVSGLDPERHATLGQTYDAVMSAYPDLHIEVIAPSVRPWLGDKTLGWLPDRGRVTVWTRPDTGAVIGISGDGTIRLLEALAALHTDLMLPRGWGRLLVTAMSLVLLFSVISGLMSYRRFWKGFLRRPSAEMNPRMRAGVWHRLVAVWVAPFLLVMGLTGGVFLLHAAGFQARSGGGFEPVAARDAVVPAGFTGAVLDRAMAELRQQVPGFRLKVAGFPGDAEGVFDLSGYDARSGSAFSEIGARIDPSGGRLLGVSSAARGNFLARIDALVYALHFGEWGGFASILLWGVFGLSSLVLLFMGARVYVARSRAPGARTGPVAASLAYLRGLSVFGLGYLALAALIAREILRRL